MLIELRLSVCRGKTPLHDTDDKNPIYVDVGTPVKIGEVDDPAIRELLSHFESLGSDCEFGLTQRRYGAEPTSLLRWSTATPSVLIDLLSQNFAGIGDLAQTHLRVADWSELLLFDNKYNYLMHSFVHESGVDRTKFLADQCGRLKHLTIKIQMHLAEASKIFVYHAPDLSDAPEIHRLMRSYGPNVIVLVHLADGEHPSGTVTDCADGRLDAYISRYGCTQLEGGLTRWFIDFDAWLAICRASLELRAIASH